MAGRSKRGKRGKRKSNPWGRSGERFGWRKIRAGEWAMGEYTVLEDHGQDARRPDFRVFDPWGEQVGHAWTLEGAQEKAEKHAKAWERSLSNRYDEISGKGRRANPSLRGASALYVNPGPQAHARSASRQQALFKVSGREYHRGARDAHRGVPAANPRRRKKAPKWVAKVDAEMTRNHTHGPFRRQAERAGMEPYAFARKVLRSPDRYTRKTVNRARLALRFEKMNPHRGNPQRRDTEKFLDAVKQRKLRDAYDNLNDMVRQGAITARQANKWRAEIEDRILGGDR